MGLVFIVDIFIFFRLILLNTIISIYIIEMIIKLTLQPTIFMIDNPNLRKIGVLAFYLIHARLLILCN